MGREIIETLKSSAVTISKLMNQSTISPSELQAGLDAVSQISSLNPTTPSAMMACKAYLEKIIKNLLMSNALNESEEKQTILLSAFKRLPLDCIDVNLFKYEIKYNVGIFSLDDKAKQELIRSFIDNGGAYKFQYGEIDIPNDDGDFYELMEFIELLSLVQDSFSEKDSKEIHSKILLDSAGEPCLNAISMSLDLLTESHTATVAVDNSGLDWNFDIEETVKKLRGVLHSLVSEGVFDNYLYKDDNYNGINEYVIDLIIELGFEEKIHKAFSLKRDMSAKYAFNFDEKLKQTPSWDEISYLFTPERFHINLKDTDLFAGYSMTHHQLISERDPFDDKSVMKLCKSMIKIEKEFAKNSMSIDDDFENISTMISIIKKSYLDKNPLTEKKFIDEITNNDCPGLLRITKSFYPDEPRIKGAEISNDFSI